jgi:hypothetical protein
MKSKTQCTILAAVFLAVPAHGQNANISADISSITLRIEDAERTVASFDGGVIRTLAQYRLETLKMNRALLENRQLGSEVGINPELVIPAVKPNPERAADILADIQKQVQAIEAAEAEARNSGGLVQAMALTRVETEKLTLAQLQLAWYQAQYGIATPQLTAATPPPVVADDDENNAESSAEAIPAWADTDYPGIDYSARLFSNLVDDGFTISGWYGILETRAEIDDSPKVLAINFSEYDQGSFEDKRRLLLQCSEGTPSIVYDVDSYMPYDYQSDSVRVTYRIDGSDAINASWSKLTSNKGTGIFGTSSIDRMLDLMNSQKLFIRAFDNNGKTYDASFDMRGSSKAVKTVAAACGFSTLKLSKDDLKAIQALLKNAGFDAGSPDGEWGNGSKQAMRTFQESKGLEISGVPDEVSLRALGIEF